MTYPHTTPSMATYGQRIASSAFDGRKGFAIDGGIKDAT